MKLKDNIILQFSLVTFIIIFAVASSLAVLLTKRMTDETIHQHIDFYPSLARSFIGSNESELLKLTKTDNPGERPQEIFSRFGKFLNFGAIFRVKVWRLDGTVLWSDEPAIIGKNFPTNKDFLMAKNGILHYEVAAPDKEEQEYERNVKKILEIYIPVKIDNDVACVVEVYEEADILFEKIKSDTLIIWALVAVSGLLIYSLLFIIFLRAHKRQAGISKNLHDTQEAVISSLAHQAEIRDIETGRHLDRTTEYVKILVNELKNPPPKFKVRESDRNYLTDEYVMDLIKSTPLHDIGKVGIPDAILCKPGKLTDEEFAIMRNHCGNGARILKMAEEKLAFTSFLSIGIQLVQSHHERWDGQGYPKNLKGEEIPLSARIMAVADVYDALRTKRCYKKSFDHKKCVEIIKEGRGTQFDPIIVDGFLQKEGEFEKISINLAD